MILKIPVFKHTEDTMGFIELGIEYPMSDCRVDYRYFINIDNLGEYEDKKGGTNYGTVVSGGMEFITALPLKELINLVSEEAY